MEKMTLNEYIDALKSTFPTPGGGSCNAIIGKMAVALALKTFNIFANRKSFKSIDENSQNKLNNAISLLDSSLSSFDKLKEDDEKAFSSLMNELKSKDQGKIYKATEECFNVPDTLLSLLCDDLLIILDNIEFVNPNIVSDYKMSLLLLKSSLECCLFNLEINAKMLGNEYKEAYKKSVKNVDKLSSSISKVLKRL